MYLSLGSDLPELVPGGEGVVLALLGVITGVLECTLVPGGEDIELGVITGVLSLVHTLKQSGRYLSRYTVDVWGVVVVEALL